MEIIQNNYNPERQINYRVICPSCFSILEYELKDLDCIEKRIGGKRMLTCPCCGTQFDTNQQDVEEVKIDNPTRLEKTSTKVNPTEVKGEPDIVKPQSKKDRPNYLSKVIKVQINGVDWWQVDGWNKTSEEDRHIKIGDVIVYRNNLLNAEDVMVVKSFDFESDGAARALIGSSSFVGVNGQISKTYYSDFAPGIDYYRFATDEEIVNFLKEYKHNNKMWHYDFDRVVQLDKAHLTEVVKQFLEKN